jgi:hypothetical protein
MLSIAIEREGRMSREQMITIIAPIIIYIIFLLRQSMGVNKVGQDMYCKILKMIMGVFLQQA